MKHTLSILIDATEQCVNQTMGFTKCIVKKEVIKLLGRH